MKPLGLITMDRERNMKLTAEGTAEHLWSYLIGPLR